MASTIQLLASSNCSPVAAIGAAAAAAVTSNQLKQEFGSHLLESSLSSDPSQSLVMHELPASSASSSSASSSSAHSSSQLLDHAIGRSNSSSSSSPSSIVSLIANNNNSVTQTNQNHNSLSSAIGADGLVCPLDINHNELPPFLRQLKSHIEDDKKWQLHLFELLNTNTYNQVEVDLFELMCTVIDKSLFAQVDWARNSIFFKDLNVSRRAQQVYSFIHLHTKSINGEQLD